MSYTKLTSNADLFEYLTRLAEEFIKQDMLEVADKLLQANRFATGSPSEFFQEAQVVLRVVKTTCRARLTEAQLEDIDGVIEQIESAFRRIGGA